MASNSNNNTKWRAIKDGGEALKRFIHRYSTREDVQDYAFRKTLAYAPNYAKAGINEIANTIYRRLFDVSRNCNTPLYDEVMRGNLRGVDLRGQSMNAFLGEYVLPELLFMQRVGVVIDNFESQGTLAERGTKHPFLFYVRSEDISEITYEFGDIVFVSFIDMDGNTREYKKTDSGIEYKISGDTEVVGQISIKTIPFVLLELSRPLLEDVADAQIALLNLNSSDLVYGFRSNFPFYVEQYDPNYDLLTKTEAFEREDGVEVAQDVAASRDKEVKAGSTTGRRYPIGTEQPAFIFPSAEPLLASMEKQRQIIEDIRLMLNLSIANLAPKRSSADSKMVEEHSKESGVMAIAEELRQAEVFIATVWLEFLGSKNVPIILYPPDFELKSESQRISESKAMMEQIDSTPTLEAKRLLLKEAYRKIFGTRITVEDTIRIDAEVDALQVFHFDWKQLIQDVEAGICSRKFASSLRGYPSHVVEEAKAEHVERAKAIAEAQGRGDKMAARGVPDLDTESNSGSEERKLASSPDTDPDGRRRERGEAK